MGRIYSNVGYVVACLIAEQSKDQKQLTTTVMKVHRIFGRRGSYRRPRPPLGRTLLGRGYLLKNLSFKYRFDEAKSRSWSCGSILEDILISVEDAFLRGLHPPVSGKDSCRPRIDDSGDPMASE